MQTLTVTVLDQEIEIEITYFRAGTPDIIRADPMDSEQGEGMEIEWEVTDNNTLFIQSAVYWNDTINDKVHEAIREYIENDD